MPKTQPIKRPTGTHTESYRLYVNLFRGPESGEMFQFVGPMPKGSAVNLAMALNKINVQEAQRASAAASGLSESEFLRLSAKAKPITSIITDGERIKAMRKAGISAVTDPLQPDTHWVVEISENLHHTGNKHRPEWLKALNTQLEQRLYKTSLGPRADPSGSPSAERLSLTPSMVDDSQDDAFLAVLARGAERLSPDAEPAPSGPATPEGDANAS